jgi:biotin synthase-like enzyme
MARLQFDSSDDDELLAVNNKFTCSNNSLNKPVRIGSMSCTEDCKFCFGYYRTKFHHKAFNKSKGYVGWVDCNRDIDIEI